MYMHDIIAFAVDLDLCNAVWTNVESYQGAPSLSSQSSDWTSSELVGSLLIIVVDV